MKPLSPSPQDPQIERHPLQPFLPPHARVLFLGSFPPPRQRWSMDFFYPNWINDFWRVMGLLFFDDRAHFELGTAKRFSLEQVKAFAWREGLAFFDTARSVRRLKGNASDRFLEIVEATEVAALLREMPACAHVVTTGGKASEQLLLQTGLSQVPGVGTAVSCQLGGRQIQWWRMPSTSRAYPMKLEQKAAFYRCLFSSLPEASRPAD